MHGLADRRARPADRRAAGDGRAPAALRRALPARALRRAGPARRIARALAVEPRILVLDEPTSALDVSVRAEVMNLLLRLQEELGLAFVFISHDLGMVRHISDEIQVMYLGRVVEAGPYDLVLDNPRHPYTRALAAAVPVPDPELEEERRGLEHAAPAVLAEPEAGCPYNPRCPLAEEVCFSVDPPLLELAPATSPPATSPLATQASPERDARVRVA